MATRKPPAPPADLVDESWGAAPAGHGEMTATGADDDADDQSPIERVMIALAETAEPGARTRLMLYRVVAATPGKPERVEFCIDLTPDEFEAQGLGGIRETWGAGTYEARLMGHKKGSPYFVRLAAPRFTLAPLPGGATLQRVESSTAGVEAALRALADNQARLIETLAEMRNAPPPNPIAQMRETFELMSLMRAATGADQQPRQEKSSIAEIVEAIKELKEVSSLVNPGGEPEKSDLEKIMELASPLVGMAQQAMQARAQQPQSVVQYQPQMPVLRTPPQFAGDENGSQALALPNESKEADQQTAPPSSVSASGNVTSESENQETILNELQANLSALVSMAASGASVQSGAELVYEKLPDDWIELLHMGIWWDALKSAAPQVEPHAEWFKLVRASVVEMFAEDESETEKLDGSV